MAQHSVPLSLRMRVIRVAAVAATVAGLIGLGVASPAAAAGQHRGFLLLAVDAGAPVALPPGQAVKEATVACAGRGTPVAAPLTVDAVRAAFPAPLVACLGVTLTSQVPA